MASNSFFMYLKGGRTHVRATGIRRERARRRRQPRYGLEKAVVVEMLPLGQIVGVKDEHRPAQLVDACGTEVAWSALYICVAHRPCGHGGGPAPLDTPAVLKMLNCLTSAKSSSGSAGAAAAPALKPCPAGAVAFEALCCTVARRQGAVVGGKGGKGGICRGTREPPTCRTGGTGAARTGSICGCFDAAGEGAGGGVEEGEAGRRDVGAEAVDDGGEASLRKSGSLCRLTTARRRHGCVIVIVVGIQVVSLEGADGERLAGVRDGMDQMGEGVGRRREKG